MISCPSNSVYLYKMKWRKSVLFVFGMALLWSSCISRLGRPMLTGVVTDYDGIPIPECLVGEAKTDRNGWFSLPERRYRQFLLTEIFVMEAPPMFVMEPVEKQGYEADEITYFSKYGGAGRKGSLWELDTIFLKREGERFEITDLHETEWKVSATTHFDTLFFVRKEQDQRGFHGKKAQEFMLNFDRYTDNYLYTYDPKNLPDTVLKRTMDIRFSGNGMFELKRMDQLGSKAAGSGRDSLWGKKDSLEVKGTWQVKTDLVNLETQWQLLNHSYRIDEFGMDYFKLIRDEVTSPSEMPVLEQQLISTLEKSLYIGQYFEGEEIKEKTLLTKLDSLFQQGVEVSGTELMLLFARDGGGWSTITHPKVLQLVLDNYLQGPDSREDKIYWLNRMLGSAILISDPGITEVLIDSGANPKPREIWESLLHISPDYFPTYETMRLLADKLDFDLYRWCNVTPIWWLVYERNILPERKNNHILAQEMKKRKADANLVCNTERGDGYFLDPEIFPSDKNAWELAEYFGDREVLEYRKCQ